MGYREHLFFGLMFSVILSFFLGIYLRPQDMAIYVILGMIGALVPDIDHPEAYLSKKIPYIFVALAIGAYFYKGLGTYFYISVFFFFFFLILPRILYKTLGHRGVVHSLLPYNVLMIPAIILSRNTYLVLFVYIGIISHLFADSFTGNGVMYFWPYKKKYKSNIFLSITIGVFLIGLIYFLYIK